MTEHPWAWGTEVILALQSLGDSLIAPMNGITFLGNEAFYFLVLPLLYWCIDVRLGIRVALLMLFSIGLNSMLKLGFHSPRPFWVEPQVRLLTEAHTSFGFPSGHAQNSVTLWGFVATWIQRRWFWGVAILLMVLIGISRMYLGVHFLSDVLAGWLVGLATLLLYLRFEMPIFNWFRRRSVAKQVGLVFVASCSLIGLGVFIQQLVLLNWQIPGAWQDAVTALDPGATFQPLSPETLVTGSGVLFGLIGGAIWLHSRRPFSAAGSLGQRAGRYLVGAVGVAILWLGLGAAFDMIAETGWLGYVLRYVRYTLVGLWISAGAPLVFAVTGQIGSNIEDENLVS